MKQCLQLASTEGCKHTTGLSGTQATVVMVKCDIAAVDDCIAVLHLLQRARWPAMTCAMHASGILQARRWHPTVSLHLLQIVCVWLRTDECAVMRWQDAPLAKQGPRQVREIFAPKVCGAGKLAAFAGAWPVAASVLFSSVAGLLGSGGQANYAAANAVIDTWAATQHLQVPHLMCCRFAPIRIRPLQVVCG